MALEDRDDCGAVQSVFIRLVLGPYMMHFKSAGYMRESTLDILDRKVCKETLHSTAQRPSVREAIGTDIRFWADLSALLRAAIPSLERRSFTIWDPSSVDYESTSGALIASHYPNLWKDLERLNDVLSIARNVLTAGALVQDLAAAYGLAEEISRVVNCCIRVTARGYDGDAGTGDEEKWQWIVNAYKKLLITSLQSLNNLVAQNERRKLMLWLFLFDSPSEPALAPDDVPETSCASLTDVPSNPTSRPTPPIDDHDLLIAFGFNASEILDLTGAVPLWSDDQFKQFPPPQVPVEARGKLHGDGYTLFVKRTKKTTVSDYNVQYQRDPTAAEIHLDTPRRWAEIGDASQKSWQCLYDDTMAKFRQDLAVFEAKALVRPQSVNQAARNVVPALPSEQTRARIVALEMQLANEFAQNSVNIDSVRSARSLPRGRTVQTGLENKPPYAEDMRMLFTAKSGTKILESGKAELMKRLEGYDRRASYDPNTHGSEANADEEDAEEDEDDDDEEYPGSTEDGRGLLTDVPLILGPSEIEVLPMLIMSGIAPSAEQAPERNSSEWEAHLNMHTVRTHLLLSQSNGRNLLRELLIFVAAWDLREEELYFKFMVKIMEAILKNGLMPYAYHAFRDRSRSKDIISPAQAVIMKLLTCIFRARGEVAKATVAANAQMKAISPNSAEPTPRNSTQQDTPTRTDLHILNFIFTEFRQHIIPQTCALIFLQGQIHAGRASPEDFPLNLWDMERMYEGVYQYLEFFAVLTEESIWKGVLGQWEMASELVTLLRELEGGIPKLGPLAPQAPRRGPHQRALSVDAGSRNLTAVAAAAERGFGSESAAISVALPPLPGANSAFEAETPLVYPEDPPSDFEWRNLKKLTVLVLSSLIWKNKTVQEQVRLYGGLEALLGCCKVDENNPYIREHAIMCLRFAVENCEENARVIRRMAALQDQRLFDGHASATTAYTDVPREVLDTNGYETFMDLKGQVGLRRKEGAHSPAQSGTTSTTSGGASSSAGVTKPRLNTTKLTAEKAAELMQNALRDLPLGNKIVIDRQKTDALAKLDRAFESTEKAAENIRRAER
ncbi:uncharacterized protein K489DRAFT_317269 [Dissoconium aciculare CBS 342.82]|uniref:Ataxin-10 homolog n=1 Tax=Dissoconium aciculare CBS 342.82 TaxID=1314786 RepID=A0A6J3MAH8_9PEZI|nr:uncharacterized protein K489DRAFT_317269 [Dissoconium aciculare CBS 342.82]KAF1823822.1 hypothetical protein K489DRAFT_317269 [Dissoconium aciculare CBS 342.82]